MTYELAHEIRFFFTRNIKVRVEKRQSKGAALLIRFATKSSHLFVQSKFSERSSERQFKSDVIIFDYGWSPFLVPTGSKNIIYISTLVV